MKARQGEIVTGRFAGLRPERIKIGLLFDALIDHYRLHERRSLRMTEKRIKKNLVPTFGEIRAADLSTTHINSYVLKRRKEGAANATINRELELLLRAFRLGSKAEPPQVNRIPKIEMLPEDNVRTGVLEHEQYVNLRDSLPEHYRLLLVIGYHTGARLGELLKIQWHQVNFRHAEIRFDARQTKTKKARVLPIYGEMKRWLEEAAAEREANHPDCPWVFQVGGEHMIFNWRTWNSFCETAKVPTLHFHDLRRTALTNMIAAGIPEKVAMEISGHRTRKTFERYHIVSDRSIREVGQKMEEYLAGTITGTKPPAKVSKVLEMKKVVGGS